MEGRNLIEYGFKEPQLPTNPQEQFSMVFDSIFKRGLKLFNTASQFKKPTEWKRGEVYLYWNNKFAIDIDRHLIDGNLLVKLISKGVENGDSLTDKVEFRLPDIRKDLFRVDYGDPSLRLLSLFPLGCSYKPFPDEELLKRSINRFEKTREQIRDYNGERFIDRLITRFVFDQKGNPSRISQYASLTDPKRQWKEIYVDVFGNGKKVNIKKTEMGQDSHVLYEVNNLGVAVPVNTEFPVQPLINTRDMYSKLIKGKLAVNIQ